MAPTKCLLHVFLSLFLALAFVGQGSSQTAFPDIKNNHDVMITFVRADAMGGSPSYKLTINGDGTVQYEGFANVAHKGKRVSHISQTAVSELIQEFRDAHFFALSAYRSTAIDMPVRVITFQVGPIHKEVVDYGRETSPDSTAGFSSGAPESLTYLEKRIDQIVGSKKWISHSFLPKINAR